jgi:exopolysaccharide biosynthesis polyprenyl glycosylphosphotransferase
MERSIGRMARFAKQDFEKRTHSPDEHDSRVMAAVDFYAKPTFRQPLALWRIEWQTLRCSLRVSLLGNLKRLIDIFLALLALALLWPIMLLTALAIKLESPGPILFRQERVGKWGKPFRCYKFRSMCTDAEVRKAALLAQNEADGPIFKIHRDPRVTRVGRLIRKLSIDELPQLFNVLQGDMSLVGPRPPLPQEVSAYRFDQLRRLNAVPGLTGLQQVSGRSDLSFERWVELDLQYIAEQSIWKDIVILLRTIPTVIFSRGAY